MRKYRVAVYLDHAQYKRLQKEVATRKHATQSSCAADCLSEYFGLLEEMASVFKSDTDPGEAKTGKIIHALLEETERRISSTIERQGRRIDRVREDVQIMQAMLDRHCLSWLIHTPEVSEEERNARLASANRRHGNWLRAVESRLREGGIN